MTYRARSASNKTDDWPFWYVTDDQPADRNVTARVWKMVTGNDWPPVLPFLSRKGAEALAKDATLRAIGEGK